MVSVKDGQAARLDARLDADWSGQSNWLQLRRTTISKEGF